MEDRGCVLSIVPVSVRDLAIPLGGFANVMVAHAAPVLPGATLAAKRVRTLPAVMLKHKGEVTLPTPGCAVKCESGADKDKMLLALGAEPLLVELYHHDKYTRDLLLGIATVDMVKVLSVRPQVQGLRTRYEHVQTVPFIAPAEGLLPEALAGDAATTSDGTSPTRQAVALLSVMLRLDFIDKPPPIQSRTRKATPRATAAVAAAPQRADPPSSPKAAQLDAHKRRDVAKLKVELKEKEEERLERLTREWNAHEARRAAEARAQARAMSDVTRQLKHKLAQLMRHEEVLHATADQLALRGAALERQSEIEKAQFVAVAEKEASALRAEVHGARSELVKVTEQSSTMRERAEALSDGQARALSEAAVWRSAYESAVARAEALEVEQRNLMEEQEEQEKESARLAAENKEQRRKQRRQEEQVEEQRRAAAAAAAAAAALPARLAAIRAEYSGAPLLRDAPIGTPEGAGLTSVLDHEVAGVQRRLREHSMELQAEAREIEELRAALDARPASKPQQPPQQQPPHAGPGFTRTRAMVY